MDERDQERQVGRARFAIEDAGWFLREHVVWPVEDSFERLGRRGAIGVFGGGGIAVAGVVAALAIAGAGSGQGNGITEAALTPRHSPAPAPAAVTPTPAPKPQPRKPAGPTLHGAPPDFSPAGDVRAGIGDGQAVGGKRSGGKAGGGRGATGGIVAGHPSSPAGGKATGDRSKGSNATAGAARAGATATASEAPASTAKIGSSPKAQASSLPQGSGGPGGDRARGGGAGTGQTRDDGAGSGNPNGNGAESRAGHGNGAEPAGSGADGKDRVKLTGPPAPKAAKKVARRFAEAFVVYEIGGIDTKVRKAFNQTSTKQLSRSLLHRPPRQPASVKVPRAKVVNVVAGPSQGKVYTLSVSLLRVGVTSELRLEMERGVGNRWQVTNVLG